jgi:hypothetical protein
MSKTEPLHGILSLKKQIAQRKNIKGCKREKNQTTYKGKLIKITADFSQKP